jgi:hypothetical protein
VVWWLAAGVLWVSGLLLLEVVRVWRAMQGEPLLITGVFGSDILVQRSADQFTFVVGMTFHLLLIGVLTVALWYQLRLAQRLLRIVRRRRRS